MEKDNKNPQEAQSKPSKVRAMFQRLRKQLEDAGIPVVWTDELPEYLSKPGTYQVTFIGEQNETPENKQQEAQPKPSQVSCTPEDYSRELKARFAASGMSHLLKKGQGDPGLKPGAIQVKFIKKKAEHSSDDTEEEKDKK